MTISDKHISENQNIDMYFAASILGWTAVDLGVDFDFFFDSSSALLLSSFFFLFSTLQIKKTTIRMLLYKLYDKDPQQPK